MNSIMVHLMHIIASLLLLSEQGNPASVITRAESDAPNNLTVRNTNDKQPDTQAKSSSPNVTGPIVPGGSASHITGQDFGNTDTLPILSPSDTDTEISTLVRRHGDLHIDNRGKRVETGPMKNINTKVMSTESFDEGACASKQRGPLFRLYGNSKYFADSDNTYTYVKAKEVCRNNGLDLAELEDMEDHRVVQTFVKNYLNIGKSEKRFLIGANDIDEEGVFKHQNGKKLVFQNFLLSEPDDKNETADCVVLKRDSYGGPVGSADVDCNETSNVLCMFPTTSECYKLSKETEANMKLMQDRGLEFIVNVSQSGGYYTSNFQLSWNKAMRYCIARNMTLFSMDKYVTKLFFDGLFKWEENFVGVESLPFQFWTSGRFQGSHMTAPIFFATKPMDRSSSEENDDDLSGEMQSPHHFVNSSFAFSGVYIWSNRKGKDPGGPHGLRRELCVSFGFEKNDNTPVVRNTNCELPNFFICSQKNTGRGEDDYR